MLSEKEIKYSQTLDDLKKQIEFLESHQTQRLISEKQYLESGNRISNQLADIEKEFGIIQETLSDKFQRLQDTCNQLSRQIDEIQRCMRPDNYTLDDLFSDSRESYANMLRAAGFSENEIFDNEVHNAIERVEDDKEI